MRSQKRKLFALALAIAMIAALCVPAAWAEGEKEVVVGTYYSNWAVADEDAGESQEEPEEMIVRIVTRNPNGRVNLRAMPSIESAVLALLANGTEVVLLSREGEWLNVRHGELIGYVRQDLIDMDTTGDQEASEPQAERFVSVRSNVGATVSYGDIIVLTGELHGYDDVNYTLLWGVNDGSGWAELPGEDGLRYSFILNEQNIGYQFRLMVTTIEG